MHIYKKLLLIKLALFSSVLISPKSNLNFIVTLMHISQLKDNGVAKACSGKDFLIITSKDRGGSQNVHVLAYKQLASLFLRSPGPLSMSQILHGNARQYAHKIFPQ